MQAMTFPYATAVVGQAAYDAHMGLYSGYVTKVNEADAALAGDAGRAAASATGGVYRGWKKTETYALDGVVLHELYFSNMGMPGGAAGEKFSALAARFFGSMAAWQADFSACAVAARGWCIAAWCQRSGSLRNILLDTHDEGLVAAMHPLLVLDMYEHAYFTDYSTKKADYIAKFMQCVKWDIVEARTAQIG
jgi:Fe-Mn family superoxide dismutase